MFFHFFSLYFFSLAFASGDLVLTSTGKDLTEAQVRAIRQAVAQTTIPEKILLQDALEQEVVPHAQQFISSYRVIESGKGGLTTIQATVDSDLLRSLVSINPKTLGLAAGAKVLLLTKGPKLANGKEDAAYTSSLDKICLERLQRRNFALVKPTPVVADQVALSEDVLTPEFMQPLGQKMDAALVVAFTVSVALVENENNHNSENRIFLEGALLDVKKNAILARHKSSILAPQGRREVTQGLIEAAVKEKGDDVLQELLVRGGTSFLSATAKSDSLVIRVLDPESYSLVNKFRLALEGQRDVQKIVEKSVRRGAYDFVVDTALKANQFASRLPSISGDTFTISVEGADLGKEYDLAVRLMSKPAVHP